MVDCYDNPHGKNFHPRGNHHPGGSIMNVVRYASLRAIANNSEIRRVDLMEGIRREFGKEGKGV